MKKFKFAEDELMDDFFDKFLVASNNFTTNGFILLKNKYVLKNRKCVYKDMPDEAQKYFDEIINYKLEKKLNIQDIDLSLNIVRFNKKNFIIKKHDYEKLKKCFDEINFYEGLYNTIIVQKKSNNEVVGIIANLLR